MLTSRRTRWAPALSALADGSGEGGLAADEAVMMTMLLLVAGHETTANLIGSAVAALHSHPGTARQLRRDPDRLPATVEEFLRYDSPVQLASRVAARDTGLGDAVVRKGEQVLVGLPAANRDPAAFSHPDRARVEAQEVLRRLLDLTPPVEDRELTLVRGRSATFRRVTNLMLH